MAGFNGSKKVPLTEDKCTTLNHEGERVHKLDSLETLFSRVLGSFFGESTFYERRNAEEEFKKLVKTINSVDYEDIEYVLKIALLGREHNMIQYPLEILSACFNDERFKGNNFVDEEGHNKLRFYSDRIIRRSKDVVDIMATQINAFGFDVKHLRGRSKKTRRDIPLPIQLRKCLKSKLESFNEYQLSKGLSTGKEVTLADCIKLLHPCEKEAKVREGFYRSIIENRVEMGAGKKQIQSELSKSRNKNSDSTLKDVKDSLDTSTLMAIVKNLIALYRAGIFKDDESIDSICSKLTSKKEVQSSKLLPFRFYSAFKELRKVSSGDMRSSRNVKKVMDALSVALDLSIDNLTPLEGYNAILIDTSGSMDYSVSAHSVLTAKEIAAVLGAICFKQGTSDLFVFANVCKKITWFTRNSSTIDIVSAVLNTHVGGGTYLSSALQYIFSFPGTKYDNLILLSDNDCYSIQGNSFSIADRGYGSINTDTLVNILIREKRLNKFYLNNLLGNDFAVVNTNDYRKNLITGFSEKFCEMINIYSRLGERSTDIRKVIDALLEGID